jgi:NTE family protein
VLGGGGALGAFQAGVYEALEEAGREPDRLVGTSIGALNAA